ncbi:hypothetical protein HOC35_00595 [Candidatus Woesearchaeota archaeon]|jgi:hypothetical protein|nr:hypothetical protein [Candidatus Woesearchaeota archaeon]
MIKKLHNNGCFGKGHLLVIRLKKGTNPEDIYFTKKVLKELIKQRLVFLKKTKHGLAAYLNINKLQEIEEIIEYKS